MKSLIIGCAMALGVLSAPASAQEAPFGTDADAEYAALIWDVMVASNLAGANAPLVMPTDGDVQGHGRMLATLYSTGTIGDNTGDLIVKRNYGPEGVTAEEILAAPEKHLGAITVMYRREAGFDEDNGNWFWVMFLPDGTLGKNAKGMRMAGKIAKGANVGCIACHSLVEDMVYTTDHLG
ncbi:MAG: hypothetical protein ACC619_02260 [Paracoccaceae bacterium]